MKVSPQTTHTASNVARFFGYVPRASPLARHPHCGLQYTLTRTPFGPLVSN